MNECTCPLCKAGYPLYRTYGPIRQDDGTYLYIKVKVQEDE